MNVLSTLHIERTKLASLAALALFAMVGPTVHASQIFQETFENPGGWSDGNWVLTSAGNLSEFGVYSNAAVGLPSDPDGGTLGGYYNNDSSGSPGTATHDQGLIIAKTQYDLQVYAGHRIGNSSGILTLSLLDGSNTVVATQTVNEATDVASGTYAPFSVSYTSSAAPTGDLKIKLTLDSPSTSFQTWVDDVTLTATAVPEPASLSLLGVGSLALLARRRNR